MKASFWLGFKSNIIAGILIIISSGISVISANLAYTSQVSSKPILSKNQLDPHQVIYRNWWYKNCRYWYQKEWDYPLRQELKLTPKGSTIIISEHRFNSLERFIEYFQQIQSDYPEINLIINIDIELSFISPIQLHKHLEIINRINEAGLNWMLEFSINNQPYNTYKIDQLIHQDIKDSIIAHSIYLISRTCQLDRCQGILINESLTPLSYDAISTGLD